MAAEKIKYRTGTMTKSPWDMNESEYKIWQEECKKDAREYLFSKGQPLVYVFDDKVVIENSDGTVEHRKI